jgi:hypothetical protein
MIAIRRDALGYFARATPPHVTREWANLLPLSRDNMVKALCERGTHMQDAWDVVLEAETSTTGQAEH